jgi:hypothetical protein
VGLTLSNKLLACALFNVCRFGIHTIHTIHAIHQMPPEYITRGQVSTRTDAFAYGIVMIELMASLSPTSVRKEIVDDSVFDEIPAMIRECHDKAVKQGTGCEWPVLILEQMGVLVAKCTFLQAKRRATIAEVLPELEALLLPAAEAEGR